MNTIEYVFVSKAKHLIERDMSNIAPSVRVVGSRTTEDGYDLLLEGDVNNIADLIYFWSVLDGREVEI
jgi:hypothetical protein